MPGQRTCKAIGTGEFLYLPEVLYLVILLWLFLAGPGWASVDYWLFLRG